MSSTEHKPKWEEIAGGWGNFHNGEVHDVAFTKYYQGDEVKGYEMGGAFITYGKEF
jgi:hypothetical protein